MELGRALRHSSKETTRRAEPSRRSSLPSSRVAPLFPWLPCFKDATAATTATSLASSSASPLFFFLLTPSPFRRVPSHIAPRARCDPALPDSLSRHRREFGFALSSLIVYVGLHRGHRASKLLKSNPRSLTSQTRRCRRDLSIWRLAYLAASALTGAGSCRFS